MLEVLSAEPALRNRFEGYAPRPDYRPLTKFENRGLQARPRRVGPGVRAALRVADHSAQVTQPIYAVTSTTMPKAMRYQANGTKVWLAM